MDVMMKIFSQVPKWVIGLVFLQGVSMSQVHSVNIFCDAEIQEGVSRPGRDASLGSFQEEDEEQGSALLPRPSTTVDEVVKALAPFKGKNVSFLSFHEGRMTDQTFGILTEQLIGELEFLDLKGLDLSGNNLTFDCKRGLEKWLDKYPEMQIDVSGNIYFSGFLRQGTLKNLGDFSLLLHHLIVFTQTEVEAMNPQHLEKHQTEVAALLPDGWLERHKAYWSLWNQQGMGALVDPTYVLPPPLEWTLLRRNEGGA